MRIVRFKFRSAVKYGILKGNAIQSFRGNPFLHFKGSDSSLAPDGNMYALRDVRLLAPCSPSKIVCLGLNYRSHAEETNLPLPSVPLIFLKPSTAVVGNDDAIILPHGAGRVDYEGELGVVIGARAKNIPAERARDYILGYTCFNDVTERHNQRDDGQWTRAKGYDTFAPIGPWIETEIVPDDLSIKTSLNGQLRQSTRTSDLIFSVDDLIHFISNVMTLLPGDVIATGTPSGIGRMAPGDVVEVTVDKIGTLRNYVKNQTEM